MWLIHVTNFNKSHELESHMSLKYQRPQISLPFSLASGTEQCWGDGWGCSRYVLVVYLKNARFRHRTSHEPNRMLMRENKGFSSHLHSIRLMWSTASELGISDLERRRQANLVPRAHVPFGQHQDFRNSGFTAHACLGSHGVQRFHSPRPPAFGQQILELWFHSTCVPWFTWRSEIPQPTSSCFWSAPCLHGDDQKARGLWERGCPIDVKPALGWRRRVMRRGFDIFQNIAVKFLILGQKSPPVPHPGKGFVVTGTSNIPTPGTAR